VLSRSGSRNNSVLAHAKFNNYLFSALSDVSAKCATQHAVQLQLVIAVHGRTRTIWRPREGSELASAINPDCPERKLGLDTGSTWAAHLITRDLSHRYTLEKSKIHSSGHHSNALFDGYTASFRFMQSVVWSLTSQTMNMIGQTPHST
jgi:hypothetical protein